MNNIKKLPGDACRHFNQGRCLYEEWLNPGYAKSWRCQVVTRWEDAYDEFLHRAEQFRVEQNAVPDLWRRQFQRLARETFHCRTHTFEPGKEPPACLHYTDGICVLGLPACHGRCRHFDLENSLDSE